MGEKIYKIFKLKTLKIIIALIILILLGVFFYCIYSKSDFKRKVFSDEFLNGSNIVINNLDNNEVESLSKLCKVWGFIKYYHPKAIEGDIDMDFELFKVIPLVMEAKNEEAVNRVIYDWVNSFGEFDEGVYSEEYEEECALKVGDVILRINDKDIFEVINEQSKYFSFSWEEAIVNTLAYNLFRSKEYSLTLKVERAGSELIEDIKCYNVSDVNIAEVKGESHELLEGNIGDINPGALAKGEIEKIMKNLKYTDSIIVDLRYFPSDMIAYTMPNYLLPEKTVFSKGTIANIAVPGEFIFCEDITVGMKNPDYYKGKVVIIINECTQSQGEFTAMALRRAPNAVVIGENSVGADGNVSYINLPGGVTTVISGVGIYTPETFETQRVGVKPDIYVKPTIEGIRSGKDELLDKAIEIVKDKK